MRAPLSLLIMIVGCGQSPSASGSREPTHAEPEPAGESSPEPPRARAFEPTQRLGTVSDGLGLETGVEAPDGRARDIDGQVTTLSSLFARGPTMLIFYRGGWCPFCNFQIRELTEHHTRFTERNMRLVLVSVDRVEEAARTSATYEIPIPVLSDPNLRAHRAYDVLQEVDAETLARYEEMGIDLEHASGRDHHTIAVPAVFVVRDGRIEFRHVDRDYRVRPTVNQLLEAIDSLNEAGVDGAD